MESKEENVSTKFVADGTVTEESFVTATESDDLSVKNQGLKDFFAKPILVSNGTWSSSMSSLYSTSVSALYLATSAWTNKSAGYNMVRGTFCMQLQINATPFHQGKLLMYWDPTKAFYATDISASSMHTTKLIGLSQLPNVELDCRESAAILKVPYIAPSSWFVKNSPYDWGTVGVIPLAALAYGTGTDTNVSYSIWAWFEDMEFAVPIVPQSGKGASKRTPMRSFGKTVDKVEAAVMGIDSVSKGLSAVSVAADALSTVPMVGAVAGPLAWAADVGSGVASAFGWSKPDNNGAPSTMVNLYNRYMATSDGVDVGIPLSLRANHEVKVSDRTSIRDVDEMSWAYLKGVPAVTNADPGDILTWLDTATEGASLVSTKVGLGLAVTGASGPWAAFSRSIDTHTGVYSWGPPAWYVAQKFAIWRGSICVKLKFVKTDFHTGRLLLTWTPGHSLTTTPNPVTSQLSIREIIDLKDSNELCITLPWMVELNYLSVPNDYSGQLDIQVLNVLRRPDTCSSSIQILAYWSGGPDLEVAATGKYQTSNVFCPMPFTPQMNMSSGEESVRPDGPLADCEESVFTVRPSEQSIGEMFTSIKQLLMRNSQLMDSAIANYSATATNMSFWPWVINVPFMQSSTGLLTGNQQGGDIYSYFAPMYLFYKGDMRVTLVTPATVTAANLQPTSVRLNAFVTPLTGFAGNAKVMSVGGNNGLTTSQNTWYLAYTSGANYTPGSAGISVMNAGPGFCTWKVPYMSQYRSSYLIPTTSSVQEVSTDVSQSINFLQVLGPVGTFTDYQVFRSVADDFHFSFFLGAPPILISFA